MSKPDHPALKHLEDAEASIISHMARFMAAGEDDELPDSFTTMMAVLRSVSRAAGMLETHELKISE